MKIITVNTERSYNIVIENGFYGLVPLLLELFPDERQLFIITDKNVGALYGEELLNIFSGSYKRVFIFTVESGENTKNIEILSNIFDFLLQNGADRGSVLIALGGGVVGDITGFAASVYMRGIPYVQIPTTLLAQVDSSVGGKTAIDFGGYKNIIGAFYQPSLVYINAETLQTLPSREFSSGMAEVLKYGLILDKQFYSYLSDNILNIRDNDALSYVISRCVELKASVVEKDENDLGIREILNYGHTLGHAVESLTDFKLLHGECVALGTIAAMRISVMRGMLQKEDIEKYKELLKVLCLPFEVPELSSDKIYNASLKDKKMKSGRISFVLINGIGQASGFKDVTGSEMLCAIKTITNEG